MSKLKPKSKKTYKYNVFFTIEERGKKGEYKMLRDNFGYLCGIYATYRQAKASIPKIRRRIVNHLKRKERMALNAKTV